MGEQWRDMLQFWLKEYKVDGFRFDLVKGLGNNDSYANSGDAATNAFNQSRIDRMKLLHGYIKEVNPDAYFINENLAGAQEENEMAKDGELNWMNLNNAGCQFAMGYQADSNLNSMNAKDAGRTPDLRWPILKATTRSAWLTSRTSGARPASRGITPCRCSVSVPLPRR